MRILMVASENDALPGVKVGGIADVVRDIPLALAAQDHELQVVIPAYGFLSTLNEAQFRAHIVVRFAGQDERVELFKINQTQGEQGVTQWVLAHPRFAVGGIGQVYCDDPGERPFATDAGKFALFSAAVAAAIVGGHFGALDVLHLHDWHVAVVALLRAYDPQYHQLKSVHTVYTIHNLALQGIRPFQGDESALDSWFEGLDYEGAVVCDPRYPQCFNPMRAAINLADKVHAVSVNYAKEILKPSNHEQGYFGGEGLEQDLVKAHQQGRLVGILNGCEYPEVAQTPTVALQALLKRVEQQLLLWLANTVTAPSAHIIALNRIRQWLYGYQYSSQSRQMLVTSVGRITDQKMRLLQQPLDNGHSALSTLLTRFEHQFDGRGLVIVLGNGDLKIQQFLTKLAAKHSNLLYLQGYAPELSNCLYRGGDLFLMPSSFEPCGISQMLSMRGGQPCLAHGVGGLSDTITHMDNGFTFSGDSTAAQANNMLEIFAQAVALKQSDCKRWQKIKAQALASRFLWSDAATAYVKRLYG